LWKKAFSINKKGKEGFGKGIGKKEGLERSKPFERIQISPNLTWANLPKSPPNPMEAKFGRKEEKNAFLNK